MVADNDRSKVRVVKGRYKGEAGIVNSVLWFCNMVTVITDSGEEVGVYMNEIEKER